MNDSLKFKKSVILEFIRLKEEEIQRRRTDQRAQLDDVNNDDIDLRESFESRRSQMQDEIGQQSDPIDFLVNELELLRSIHADELHTHVTFGSLVDTFTGYFLVAGSQQQFEFEGKKMTGISVGTHLFKKMEGMKAKAEFHFGNITTLSEACCRIYAEAAVYAESLA